MANLRRSRQVHATAMWSCHRCNVSRRRLLGHTSDFDCSPSVRYRPHRIQVSPIHQSPAYLDEEYPIVIGITNEDDRPLDVVLDILLQPTEIDEAGTSHLHFMST
jgi:hypothetical protein